MILLDTNAIIFDALQPSRLSRKARDAITAAHERHDLACADISLWEIAMLIAKGRLDPGLPAADFLTLAITARSLTVLPIVPAIAALSTSLDAAIGSDPADRLVVATAIHHRAPLITTDGAMLRSKLSIRIFK